MILTILACGGLLFAQPLRLSTGILIAPEHPDWLYRTGEVIRFRGWVLKNGVPVRNARIIWEAGMEKMVPAMKDSVSLKSGEFLIEYGPVSEPCIIRCRVRSVVDKDTLSGFATAAVDPYAIKPTAVLPSDFRPFWDSIMKLTDAVPLDPLVQRMPERCVAGVEVFHVRLSTGRGYVYGILCKPSAVGKYPVLLELPGAGVWQHPGDTDLTMRGIITFQIDIHGIPLDQDPELYTSLSEGILHRYWENLPDDREDYYYLRVLQSCRRAVDYLTGMPEAHGRRVGVKGDSQGGGLALMIAALDDRISCAGAYYPAFCDHTGFMHNRAGGWPYYFSEPRHTLPEKVSASSYYDVVNFARFLKIPIFCTWGLNDEVCPPTSMYAAYNTIASPKKLQILPPAGHQTEPAQRKWMTDWLENQLSVNPERLTR